MDFADRFSTKENQRYRVSPSGERQGKEYRYSSHGRCRGPILTRFWCRANNPERKRQQAIGKGKVRKGKISAS